MTTPRRDIPILEPRQEWDCPNCDTLQTTFEARPHTRMHPCPGMRGLTLPMTEKSRVAEHSTSVVKRAKVTPVVREDYEAGEHGLVRDENGAPIMAAVTEYPDGTNDVAVYAPSVLIEMRQG